MKRNILIFMFATLCLWSRQVSAFWGSDSTDTTSGLNVAAGFDVNTITTVAGRVTMPPERKGEDQHTVMMVATTQGTVTVVLGPWSYWEKQVITLAKNLDITITGSLAESGSMIMYQTRHVKHAV